MNPQLTAPSVNTRPERQEKVFDIRNAPSITNAAGYFAELAKVLHRIPHDTIDQITARLARAYEENRTVFLFGNGGSAALASHSACDLGKGTAIRGKRRFRVMALTDNIPVMTAWANDSRYDDIFAEQLLESRQLECQRVLARRYGRECIPPDFTRNCRLSATCCFVRERYGNAWQDRTSRIFNDTIDYTIRLSYQRAAQ